MSFRALAALVLLLFALAAERCGYYAARSVLMIDLTQHHGLSSDAARAILLAFTFVAYGSAFVGGGLAFAFGPRATAITGAVVAAIGALCLAGGAPPLVACLILGLGGGIFKACPYAA